MKTSYTFRRTEVSCLMPACRPVPRRRRLLGLGGMVLLISATGASAAPTPPDRLRILPDHGGTKKAELMWEDNSGDETGFEVHRKIDAGSFSLVHITGANVTTWTDSGLDAAREYTYKVRAVKDGEQSAYTNESKVNFTLSWPMNVAEADVELLHGYGDGLGLTNEKMHIGVDPQAGAGGQDALAPRCVLVISNSGAGTNNQGMWVQYRLNGTSWYFGINHLYPLDAAAQVTDGTPSTYKTVVAGQKLGTISGTIWSDPWCHVHVSHTENGWAEADNHHPLSIYSSTGKKDPKENEPKADFDYDGDGKTILFKRPDDTYIGYDPDTAPISGDVDLSVEIHDEQGTHPRQGVDVLKYWIDGPVHDVKSAAHPYMLMSHSAHWMLHNNWDVIYDIDQNQKNTITAHAASAYPWNNYHHYLVTNTVGEDGSVANLDAGQYWNTDASGPGTSGGNGFGAPDADDPADAHFPDGWYDIHILMSDLVHTDVEHVVHVRVDNFADYGDAPNAAPDSYPSSKESGGPYHLDVTKEWIGSWDQATTTTTTSAERDSKQVNADDDDGESFFGVRSATYDGHVVDSIFFHTVVFYDPALSSPEEATRYLNVLVDVNENGEWGGPGEWPIRNRKVRFETLSRVRVVAGFAAADAELNWHERYVDKWTRVTLSTEKVPDGTGQWGILARGETEDGRSVVRGTPGIPVDPPYEPLPPKLDEIEKVLRPEVEYAREGRDADGSRVGIDGPDPDATIRVRFPDFVAGQPLVSWQIKKMKRVRERNHNNTYDGEVMDMVAAPPSPVLTLPAWLGAPSVDMVPPANYTPPANPPVDPKPQVWGAFDDPSGAGRSDFRFKVHVFYDPDGEEIDVSTGVVDDDLAEESQALVIEAKFVTESTTIPTVSTWGLAILTLLLLTGLKIKFGRRRTVEA